MLYYMFVYSGIRLLLPIAIDTRYDVCLHNIIGTQLTAEQQNLILTRSNNLYIDGFSNNDINYIIDYIAIN